LASTIQLQRSITLASAFVRYAPLTLSTNDPALSNADWVRQFILSPPFAWRWNRAVTTFTTAIGSPDYVKAITNLGWIEKAVIYEPNDGNETHELEVSNNLAVETQENQPTKISAQLDDDAGNITFRLVPAPDKVYTVEVTYQKSSPLFTAPTETWAPLPDYLSYMYNQGFLAKALEYINDSRFAGSMQLFLQQLVAANNGLSDAQKNIFMADQTNTQRQSQNVQAGRG
jgi:hypothetical protein